MHGFMVSVAEDRSARASLSTRIKATLARYWLFMTLVILPTLVVGCYLYAFAADQYQSEAHFLVRSQQPQQQSSSGLSALLGGSASVGSSDANSVVDYLDSHDVTEYLRRHVDLVRMFRRPEADALSRLRRPDPTPEELLHYYQGQVKVSINPDTGIADLLVRTFRPVDSYRLATALLVLGEQRVNELNARSLSDAVSLSKLQLEQTEHDLAQVQSSLTAFRQTQRDLDPQDTAEAQIKLVTDVKAQLVAARAQLATTGQLIGTNNPQYAALVQRVRSLEAQASGESGRLAGSHAAIAVNLGDYERLKMQQDFLAKRYDLVNTAYETARQQAVRQQLYIVRTVDPNLPVKSLYPQRGVITASVFAALLLLYGIGWLIAAGVREHAE